MLRQYNHYTWHHTLHVCICMITPTVSMIKHILYDNTPTVYMAHCAQYMTSHTWFMTSEHSIHDIKTIISHITSRCYIWQHIHCICINILIIYHITPIVYIITDTTYMTSYELHMMSHPIFIISQHAMTSHPLYSCHHTQYTCHCILCSCVINDSVLITKHLQ